MVKVRATRSLENAFRRWGFHLVAGCDEVGRGCLAGPVVAGAVILDPARHIPGLFDSKMTTAIERERLYDVITRRALAWAVASASPIEIDRINIHRASLDAMRQAIGLLEPLPDMVVVDAFKIPDLMMAQIGVPKGDRKVSAVAAASIVAKVTRDREMQRHHEADPRYGYDRHKGYATAEHLAAVALHGYSSLHRRTFKPATLFDTME
ncbi:MAG: ribonuclease HII [Xanthobacteraceae bacterium]